MPPPPIQIHRADDRFSSRSAGIDSWHCFSFGQHYDPRNVAFGPLTACNEERLAPGAGFDWHGHRELDIVTWVVAGRLRHRDSLGHDDLLGPGDFQHLSAGSGVEHSETNGTSDPDGETCRFVQLWFAAATGAAGTATGAYPDAATASYDRIHVGGKPSDDPILVASGEAGEENLRLCVPGVRIWVWQPEAAGEVSWPVHGRLFGFVARGRVSVEGEALGPGDTVRALQHPGVRLTAARRASALVCSMP